MHTADHNLFGKRYQVHDNIYPALLLFACADSAVGTYKLTRYSTDGGDTCGVGITFLAEHDGKAVGTGIALADEERERHATVILHNLRPLDVIPVNNSAIFIMHGRAKRWDRWLRPVKAVTTPAVPTTWHTLCTVLVARVGIE